MDHVLLSSIESRIENNQNLYGCFQLGPFHKGQGITIANAMRRTLLSEFSGLAIVCVEIQGISHEYSNIKGVRESVLDILLNLKKIIFISDNSYTNLEIGFLKIQGPAIVKSCDLKLPTTLKCVDPSQYIATLCNTSCLEIKFLICKGKNFVIQTSFDLITKKFHSFFYYKKKNKNKVSIINKQNFIFFKQEASENFFNFKYFNENLKKSIYKNSRKPILVKAYQKEKKFLDFLHTKRVLIWRKKYFLKNIFFTNFPGVRKIKLFPTKLFFKPKKRINTNIKFQKKFFHNFSHILVYSTLTVSNFQSFRNLIYKQNLNKNVGTNILLVDPVFMPITKVNFSIQNIENFYKIKHHTLIHKFQKKFLTEKIILEICTNGSIDPKNALYKVTQKIIEKFIPFQKIYFTKKKKN